MGPLKMDSRLLAQRDDWPPTRPFQFRARIGIIMVTGNMAISPGIHPRLKGWGRLQIFPRPQWQRVPGQDERGRGDQAFADKHRIEDPEADYLATITDEAIAFVGKPPLFGRSGNETLRPMGRPGECLRDTGHLPEDHCRRPGENLGDPSVDAGHACGGRYPR